LDRRRSRAILYQKLQSDAGKAENLREAMLEIVKRTPIRTIGAARRCGGE
jgi:hypothetical protein